jgi:anti-sigma factor RsiW
MSDQTTCKVVQETLSEYVEGNLPPPRRQAVETHLAGCASCARDARRLEAMLLVLHGLPAREPSLDIWMEMAPKVAQIQHEQRLSVPARLRLRIGRFLSTIAAGSILFTQALAHNTESRMRKYLLQDPFGGQEGVR